MSYNIDTIKTNVNSAHISAQDIILLYETHRNDMPEDCFLSDLRSEAEKALNSGDPTRMLPIVRFAWRGERSGRSYEEFLLAIVVPKIQGTVEAIVIWEGGDSVAGLAIKDGKHIMCDVEQRLVLPVGW